MRVSYTADFSCIEGEGIEHSIGSGEGEHEEDDDSGTGKAKQKKRGIFPKHATTAMRNWLFQHLSVSVKVLILCKLFVLN